MCQAVVNEQMLVCTRKKFTSTIYKQVHMSNNIIIKNSPLIDLKMLIPG